MDKSHSFVFKLKRFSQQENLKFLAKLFLFLFMVTAYLYHMLPQYDGSYCAALQDKVERLESIEGAKIVLLGDSNLTFGIESEMIESALGMPVVNMGLHAGLGNRFHEDMARYNVAGGGYLCVMPHIVCG